MDNTEHSGQRLWIKTVLQKACAKNAAKNAHFMKLLAIALLTFFFFFCQGFE